MRISRCLALQVAADTACGGTGWRRTRDVLDPRLECAELP